MNDKSKDDAENRSKSAPKRAGRKPLEKTQPSVWKKEAQWILM